MATGEFILYTTDDGTNKIQLRAEAGTVWLTQAEIAKLFDTTPQNITLHIKSIYSDLELSPESTCKDFLQVQTEGERQIQRTLKQYNLDMILAVGYRIRSPRATTFRQWATTTLKEYLIKGFAMDDERLKNPKDWDHFDELLERIREIRASEQRFYQKVKDIYTLSIDYQPKSKDVHIFFKSVQNKMLYVVTGCTAAELITKRSDANVPNMGLTSFKGSRVRKGDVVIAKNYLSKVEITELDRIVTMFLDYAEDQTKRRQTITMRNWEERLDSFLHFNERKVLTNLGRVSHDSAEVLVHQRYVAFDKSRKEAERIAADEEDLKELEQIQKSLDHDKK